MKIVRRILCIALTLIFLITATIPMIGFELLTEEDTTPSEDFDQSGFNPDFREEILLNPEEFPEVNPEEDFWTEDRNMEEHSINRSSQVRLSFICGDRRFTIANSVSVDHGTRVRYVNFPFPPQRPGYQFLYWIYWDCAWGTACGGAGNVRMERDTTWMAVWRRETAADVAFTSHPQWRTEAQVNSHITFSAGYRGANARVLWEMSHDQGATWGPITVDHDLSDSGSSSRLTVIASIELNYVLFRAVATNNSSRAVSHATLVCLVAPAGFARIIYSECCCVGSAGLPQAELRRIGQPIGTLPFPVDSRGRHFLYWYCRNRGRSVVITPNTIVREDMWIAPVWGSTTGINITSPARDMNRSALQSAPTHTVPIRAYVNNARSVSVWVNGRQIPATVSTISGTNVVVTASHTVSNAALRAQQLVIEVRADVWHSVQPMRQQRVVNIGNVSTHSNHPYHMPTPLGYVGLRYHTADGVIPVRFVTPVCDAIFPSNQHMWIQEILIGMNMWSHSSVPVTFIQNNGSANVVQFGHCDRGTMGLMTPVVYNYGHDIQQFVITMYAQNIINYANRFGYNLPAVIRNISSHEFGHVLGLNDLRLPHMPFNSSIMLHPSLMSLGRIPGITPFDVNNANRLFPHPVRR